MELSKTTFDKVGFVARRDCLFYGFALQTSGHDNGELNLDITWSVDQETSDEYEVNFKKDDEMVMGEYRHHRVYLKDFNCKPL